MSDPLSLIDELIAERADHVAQIQDIDAQLAEIAERVQAAINQPAPPRKVRKDKGVPKPRLVPSDERPNLTPVDPAVDVMRA
jgi:hypothetical protein